MNTQKKLEQKLVKWFVKAVLILSICSCTDQSVSLLNWSYINIDQHKGKWGDWDQPDWLRYFGLDHGDVNHDGLDDVLSGRYVYLNPGGNLSSPWARVVLDDNVDGIFIMDVDGDPNADLIAQALPDIWWYEALDSSGTCYARSRIAQIPATSHVNSQGFELARILGGNQKFLLIAGDGNVYAIRVPDTLHTLHLWETRLIANNTSDEGIGLGDIDGDLDLDLVCGRRPEGGDEPLVLVWFENPGTIDKSWKDYEIGWVDHPIDRIKLADLNQDGINEIVMAEERYPGLEPDGSIYIFSKDQELTDPWQKKLLATQYSSNNLDLADANYDGYIDILTGEHKGNMLELQLWLNDGKGEFTKLIIDTGKENHLGAQWADIDRDGDLDILGSAWDDYDDVHLWRNDRFEMQSLPIKTSQLTTETKIFETNYEGAPHFLVKSQEVIFYYDKAGGGFSRIIDSQGNDWVAFARQPWGEYPASAASSYRGLPNLVWQGPDDGAGHPGHQRCTSWIEDHSIITESLNGKWRWSWRFDQFGAHFSILKSDPKRAYWFLYEGTPGGKYQPQKYYFGTNIGGPERKGYDYFNGGIHSGNYQWMYSGVDGLSRVFYLIHHEPDQHPDIISYLGNSPKGVDSKDGMTVWGFGRNLEPAPLLRGPNNFTLGFYPEEVKDISDHSDLTNFIKENILKHPRHENL